MTFKSHLEKHLKEEKLSLHMPGHKGAKANFDTTELPTTDDLLAPYKEGELKVFLRRIESLYGAEEAFIGTNGSTGLLMSALMLIGEGEEVILPRYSHQSIYHGLIQNDLRPVFLRGEIDVFDIPRPPKATDYLKLNAAPAIFTEPTYHGFREDYSLLKKRMAKKISVLDSAHGAHLNFLDQKLNNWMDIIIMSMHKSLGGLNQSAVALTKKAYGEKMRSVLGFYQTTSPSFPIILSIEETLKDLEIIKIKEKEVEMLRLKEQLKQIRGLDVLTNDDPFKIIIVGDQRVSMKVLAQKLWQDKGISFEIVTDKYLLGILSFYDTSYDYEYLLKSLEIVSLDLKLEDDFRDKELRSRIHLPSIGATAKEAFLGERELVSLKKSLGRISSSFYTPYPPGVPLLAPGEIIDEKVLEIMTREKFFHGGREIETGNIFVLK